MPKYPCLIEGPDESGSFTASFSGENGKFQGAADGRTVAEALTAITRCFRAAAETLGFPCPKSFVDGNFFIETVDPAARFTFVAFSVNDVREAAEECNSDTDAHFILSLSDEQIHDALQRAWDFNHIIWDDGPSLDVEAFASIARGMFDADGEA